MNDSRKEVAALARRYAAEALTALAEIAHNPDSAPASRDEARKILERRLPQ
jgi:hypothetical protein